METMKQRILHKIDPIYGVLGIACLLGGSFGMYMRDYDKLQRELVERSRLSHIEGTIISERGDPENVLQEIDANDLSEILSKMR